MEFPNKKLSNILKGVIAMTTFVLILDLFDFFRWKYISTACYILLSIALVFFFLLGRSKKREKSGSIKK
jgi:cell division protein FtsW (lipid II flippase)